MPSLRRQANVSANFTRVQNVSTEQTLKSSAGVLHKILLANAAAAVGTLTITDGATVRHVAQILGNTTLQLEYDLVMSTSVKVTPSATTIDALIFWS